MLITQFWVSVHILVIEDSGKKKQQKQKRPWTGRIYIPERGDRKKKSASKFVVRLMMIEALKKKQG